MADAVIVSTARTPIGKAFRGIFNDTHGADMGAHVIKHAAERAKVELGEGVMAVCKLAEPKAAEASASASKADISSLSALLAQKWKSGPSLAASPKSLRAGEVRSFRITNIDVAQKRVDVELA